MKKLVYDTNGIWEFFSDDGALKCYRPDRQICETVCECDMDDLMLL